MSRNLRSKTNDQLLQILRHSISYRRIDARYPRNVIADNLILAHALKCIEVLQDGHVSSKHAEDLWYRELAIRIRRREAVFFYGPSKNNSNIRVSWALRDVTIVAIELIDNLRKRAGRDQHQSSGTGNKNAKGNAKEVDNTAGSSMMTRSMRNKVSAEVTRGQGNSGDVNSRVNPAVPIVACVRKNRFLMAKKDEEPTVEQQCVTRTLDSIEAWADAWLVGKLSTDEDWKGFENCLGGPGA
ncbi:hypothetical protein LTR84_012272 [Exophiala bonariae]|uniref:Uncharacterized protein n=1 Tax=Exophiala bonariae TaxID=1690606 RepID=A0AAV9NJE8_9EURO|nr:hypothetical protein LTR84_012272 [Exophiala bonariae]